MKNKLNTIWYAMITRCYDIEHPHYAHYGQKGIRVCKQWGDRQAFIDWALANGYAPGLAIDRIDPSGHYTPQNCRWITKSQNSARAIKRLAVDQPYLGVYYKEDKNDEGYFFRINHKYQTITKGPYKTARAAAQARDNYIINKGWHNTFSLKPTKRKTIRRPDMRLTPQQQDAVFKCYYYNIMRKEAAQHLKISQPTIGRYYAMFADQGLPRITPQIAIQAPTLSIEQHQEAA